MKLKTPSAPFSPVFVTGESISIDTEGKVLVLPTGNPSLLPLFNECTLNSNRLTVAESPFGGLKGSGSPDYAPGTLYTPTDGIYLTDTSGENSTKTLTAGKLKELNLLTVDTVNHAITEEFIVANTVESNSPTVIDSCDATTGWSTQDGTGTISVESGRLKLDGTTSTIGRHAIQASRALNLSSYDFITCEIECTQNCNINLGLQSGSYYLVWRHYSFTIPANTRTKFVLPLRAPAGTTGTLPIQRDASFSLSTISRIIIGVGGCVNSSANTIYIDNITADVARPAYIELQNPDNLSDSSLQLQVFDGSAYQTTGTYKLDSTYSAVGTPTSANWKLSDGTKFDDCYGSGNGRALFPKGASAETKAGSSGSITYSANKGTSKRIGFRVDLPPSDGGRTNFNKCRMKAILSYAPDAENDYSASFDFADSTNTSYGLQNISKPWVALYDPATSEIDFYLFTHRPRNLSFKRNESGQIHELTLYPGNGLLYHGQIHYSDLTRDTDSNDIPDCLEASLEGSLSKFLQSYGMVI